MACTRNPDGLAMEQIFVELQAEVVQTGKELKVFERKETKNAESTTLDSQYQQLNTRFQSATQCIQKELERRQPIVEKSDREEFIRRLTSDKIRTPFFNLSDEQGREMFAYFFNEGYEEYFKQNDLIDPMLSRCTPEMGACDIDSDHFALVYVYQDLLHIPPLLYPHKEHKNGGRSCAHYNSSKQPERYRYDTECYGGNGRFVLNVPKNKTALVLFRHPAHHYIAYSEGTHVINTKLGLKPDYRLIDLRDIIKRNDEIQADIRQLKMKKRERDQLVVSSLSIFEPGSEEQKRAILQTESQDKIYRL